MSTQEDEPTHYNSPSVVSYRVGQLEKTVAAGFRDIGNQLKDMQSNFATKSDLDILEKQTLVEHQDIRDNVEGVKKEVHEIKQWKDGIIAKIATAAVIALVLMVLALYGLDKFLKF